MPTNGDYKHHPHHHHHHHHKHHHDRAAHSPVRATAAAEHTPEPVSSASEEPQGTLPAVPAEQRWWYAQRETLAHLAASQTPSHVPVYVYNRDHVDRKLQDLTQKITAVQNFFYAMKVGGAVLASSHREIY